MKKSTFFVLGMLAVLTFGIVLAGCDNLFNNDKDKDKDDDGEGTFVAVTNITGVPTAAVMNYPLILNGTVEPSNATNKTIVWSGAGVNEGVLTANIAGDWAVIATIASGASESSSYTKPFIIRVYDASSGVGGGGTDTFGTDESPNIWAMDGKKGAVYVTMKSSQWKATADGTTYNEGTYNRISGTDKAAEWAVGGGKETGSSGLAIITGEGKMLAANFSSKYSNMNGTFTKLDTDLTFEGIWATSEPVYGRYAKIVAKPDGTFDEFLSDDGFAWGEEIIRGTYPTTTNTNPALCTITQVNLRVFGGGNTWKYWNELTADQKKNMNVSETFPMIIYSNKCETMGRYVFEKQP
ncbi:MAG: hypothetical protein LBP76_08200 [Treponema sp.]|jgi:hypothetical protein|nr:hypothetical protein [Treponema sp.]